MPKHNHDHENAECEPVRLDKWLWAARFYKTRSLAATAINGGKVHINGQRAKTSKKLHAGDELSISQNGLDREIVVQILTEKRGSASIAQTLYYETEQSIRKREHFVEQRRAEGTPFRQAGRPDKKSRRELLKLKNR